ncbi:MAG TPA: sulfite exporter TauE/SafE family protein [Kiritimatiellia bacterium]|nr:sulfite exporter TauE/SafE family protein [Kiritimatiellia bacterium]
MQTSWWLLTLMGLGVGFGASFTGLGGGFLVVPILLWIGFSGSNAVGTSVMAILIIMTSAVVAHHRLGHIDYRTGLLIGLGGLIGAQIGAQIVGQISTDVFRKIFAAILAALSIYLFVKK